MRKTNLTVAVCATLLWAGAALAKPTPGQICAAAKQTATGHKAKSKLTCYAKYTHSGGSFDLAACLTKAEAAFAKAFQRAELTKKGKPRGCTTTGDAAAIEALVDDFIAAVVEALPAALPTPTPTPIPPQSCTLNSDCPSNQCVKGTCVPLCADGIQDGNETGIDCGGSCPLSCLLSPCTQDAQCVTGTCNAGKCDCSTGYGDCDMNPANGCETFLGSVNNCGACGYVCPSYPNGIEACAGGVGSCYSAGCYLGYADCNKNSADGCEVNTSTDPNNCGSCGKVCAAQPASTCGTSGTCNGAACSLWPNGTQCAPASCFGGNIFTPAATCDGIGGCVGGVTVPCAGNLVCAGPVSCKTACASDSDCTTGHTCSSGICM